MFRKKTNFITSFNIKQIQPVTIMYNGETIVSKVALRYHITIWTYWAMLSGAIFTCIYNYSEGWYGRGLPWVVILLVAGLIGRVLYAGNIKELTVSPKYILVEYIGNKPTEEFDYKDIRSNGNFKFLDAGTKGSSVYHKQVIEMNDGRKITYTDAKFENYDELKEHIYHYMVAANQADQ